MSRRTRVPDKMKDCFTGDELEELFEDDNEEKIEAPHDHENAVIHEQINGQTKIYHLKHFA